MEPTKPSDRAEHLAVADRVSDSEACNSSFTVAEIAKSHARRFLARSAGLCVGYRLTGN
jgi:hypothetical protein